MKRIALRLLIASVALSAILGCYALIGGDLESRVVAQMLWTTVTISGTSLLAIACGPAWDRRRAWPLPVIGVALATLCALALIFGIWTQTREDLIWKSAASAGVLAMGCAHASLVALARLGPRRRWVLRATLILIAIFASTLVATLWGRRVKDWEGRAIGVLGIVVCAGTIFVPVLDRLERAEEDAKVAPPTPLPARHCLLCGAPDVALDDGDVYSCSSCGGRFRAKIVAGVDVGAF